MEKLIPINDLLIFHQLGDLGEGVSLWDGDQMTLYLSLYQGIQNFERLHPGVELIFAGFDQGFFPEKGRDQDEEVFVPNDSIFLEQSRDLPEVHPSLDINDLGWRFSQGGYEEKPAGKKK